MISEVLAEVDGLLASLRRRKSVNVNDRATKEAAVSLATGFFENVRPVVAQRVADQSVLRALDERVQDLVRLAQGNNATRSYRRLLTDLRKGLAEMNVAVLTRSADSSTASSYVPSDDERLLVITLENVVPSAAASYRQGVLDLRAGDRLSYRGTAAEFREALRETLDHLAPDADVVKQENFKLESGQTQPTMKQKVRFVLSSRGRGKTQREAAEKTASLIEELSGDVTRAIYNRASLATHVQESRDEVIQIRRYVDTILFDLLEVRRARE